MAVLETLEKWRAQAAQMRAEIARLNLPAKARPTNDLPCSSTASFPVVRSGKDVWDFVPEPELQDVDGDLEHDSNSSSSSHASWDENARHGADWLARKCVLVASRRNGLSTDALQSQVADILSSGCSQDEIQSLLTDLIGFDHLDFVARLLSHRQEITASLSKQAVVEVDGRRLLTKVEREEALRRRDYEHKNALLPQHASKEQQYPHVYRSFAANNTLSHSGRKYALPVGSERLQLDKYDEYLIPAGRKGTLQPGQRLVPISELDGLCRTTFNDYKSLNRMQSLLYPVAYTTSENMLICAPTGAVSPGCAFSEKTK